VEIAGAQHSSLTREECAQVRFFCEWCFERVEIPDGHSPYAEVLRHFMACPRRPAAATDEKVIGLATHITNLITDGDTDGEEKSGIVA
jgi:hypothetical protein